MSKKKVLLIAATGYYLGAINLPKQAKEMWDFTKKHSTPLRVAHVAVLMVISPVLTPVEYGLKVVGQYDNVNKKMQDLYKVMEFRQQMADFEQNTGPASSTL